MPRVLASTLTGTIFACSRVRDRGNGFLENIGRKQDVTWDAITAVVTHAQICENPSCMCQFLRDSARKHYTMVSLAGDGCDTKAETT